MEISPELRNKIITDLEISNGNYHSNTQGTLEFIYDEIDLYNECISWFNKLRNLTGSCNEYKLDIGQFYGIFPLCVFENKIDFCIDLQREHSWKDWFIQ